MNSLNHKGVAADPLQQARPISQTSSSPLVARKRWLALALGAVVAVATAAAHWPGLSARAASIKNLSQNPESNPSDRLEAGPTWVLG